MSNGSKARRAAKRTARDRAAAPQKVGTESQRVLGVRKAPGVQETIKTAVAVNTSSPQSSTDSREKQRKLVELVLDGTTILSEENYATVAEGHMEQLMDQYEKLPDSKKLTTTKLRSIYSLIMNIYVRVDTQEDYEQHRSGIQYLKVRMAYESGRDKSVKTFLEQTRLMDCVGLVTCFDQFKLYCRYAEALVAYFKFFGGKDN